MFSDLQSISLSSIEEIENAARRLSADERLAFRTRLAEFDAEEWDRKLEEDVAGGR